VCVFYDVQQPCSMKHNHIVCYLRAL